MVIWSLIAICYWSKLVISQWRYSHNIEKQKQFEREQEEAKQESYRRVIIQLKEVKRLIDEFLKKGEEIQHRNMKQVSPGIWINKDSTMEEVMEWLKNMIPTEKSDENTKEILSLAEKIEKVTGEQYSHL